MNKIKKEKLAIIVWLTIFFSVFIWSVIKPYDYLTWFLEIFPAIIGIIILALTYKKFKLTPLLYWFILFHMIILMIGGHYTYARTPIGEWIKIFGFDRNHYDRIGHLFQGIVPVLIAREIFIRKNIIKKNWIFVIAVSIVLTVAVLYEFLEWGTALAAKESATDFLGTQGDVWDTQTDMFLAAIGAIISLLLFSKLQDKQIKNSKKWKND